MLASVYTQAAHNVTPQASYLVPAASYVGFTTRLVNSAGRASQHWYVLTVTDIALLAMLLLLLLVETMMS